MGKSPMKNVWDNKRKENERLQKVQKKKPTANTTEDSKTVKEEDNKKE